MVTIFINNSWLLRVMRIPNLETQKRLGCDATGALYRPRTNSYDVLSERIAKIFVRRRLPQSGDLSDRATSMRFKYFDVFSGLPRKKLSLRGGRRDLNPQQPEPQSGALPLSYDHHANGEKESSASSGSAKHIFRGGCGAGGSTFSTWLPSSRNSLQLASRSTIVVG
jgi:hypothetical protein